MVLQTQKDIIEKQGVDSRMVNCLDHVDQKGSQGWQYIWNDLELPIQLRLSHEKKNILSSILVV